VSKPVFQYIELAQTVIVPNRDVMMDQQDERRIDQNVAGGFAGLLDRMDTSIEPQSDFAKTIRAAFEVWQARQYNTTISLLLDAVIRLRDSGKTF
jgi:hypothetical protein